MKKKISINLFILMILFTSMAYGQEVFKQEINASQGYNAFEIPDHVYSNGNLNSIRINNSEGEIVPYFIKDYLEFIITKELQFDTKLIENYIAEDSRENEIYVFGIVNEISTSDAIVNTLSFDIDGDNYAKSFELYGSFDNLNWEYIDETTIYDVDDNLNTTIDIPAKKFNYYKVIIINNLGEIDITSLQASYLLEDTRQKEMTRPLNTNYTIEELEKETHITISGVQNRHIQSIKINSDELYNRDVECLNTRTTLYNYDFSNVKISNNTIDLHGKYISDDEIEIIIYNEDNAPINIDDVIVTTFYEELVFEADGDSDYYLTYGDKELDKASYDMEKYKSLILEEGYSYVTLANTVDSHVLEDDGDSMDKYYELLFNVVTVLIGVILAFIVLRNFNKS